MLNFRLARDRMLLLLWLLTIHSTLTGLALVLSPRSIMDWFGYLGYEGRFFQVQGGVFHVVMGAGYGLAAIRVGRESGLIILTMVAKCCATVFLLLYYLAVEPIWIVLISGLADGAMAILVFVAYRQLRASELEPAKGHSSG